MLIKTCFNCKYHQVKEGENKENSYCMREKCWSRYSKCIANKALNRFLKEERSNCYSSFSALTHMYSSE